MDDKILSYDNLHYLTNLVLVDIEKKGILEANPSFMTKVDNVLQENNTFFKKIRVDLAPCPISFSNTVAVHCFEFQNKIHLLCSNRHLTFENNKWTQLSNLPIYVDSAVVYNNKIHLLGSASKDNGTKHYSWDGTTWNQEDNLPFNSYGMYGYGAIVYNNKIHLLGSYDSNYTFYHYSWDGTTWVEESTLPYSNYGCCLFVYDNKIHMIGAYSSSARAYYYTWDGTEWKSVGNYPNDDLPNKGIAGYNLCPIVYNDTIYAMGNLNYNKNSNNVTKTSINYPRTLYKNEWIYCNSLAISANDFSTNRPTPFVYNNKLYILDSVAKTLYVWNKKRLLPYDIYYKKI